jgi:hypothetical protein
VQQTGPAAAAPHPATCRCLLTRRLHQQLHSQRKPEKPARAAERRLTSAQMLRLHAAASFRGVPRHPVGHITANLVDELERIERGVQPASSFQRYRFSTNLTQSDARFTLDLCGQPGMRKAAVVPAYRETSSSPASSAPNAALCPRRMTANSAQILDSQMRLLLRVCKVWKTPRPRS